MRGGRITRGSCVSERPAPSTFSRYQRMRFRPRTYARPCTAAAKYRSKLPVCSRLRFWPIFIRNNSTDIHLMRVHKLQQVAVAALEDIKARDIAVFDVRHQTSLYDSMIIASADSNRQVKALANHVREKVKEAGGEILGVEGEDSGDWVLVDAGDIVVHVMQ